VDISNAVGLRRRWRKVSGRLGGWKLERFFEPLL